MRAWPVNQTGLPGGSSVGLVESPVFFGKDQNVQNFFRKGLFSPSSVLTIKKWKMGVYLLKKTALKKSSPGKNISKQGQKLHSRL